MSNHILKTIDTIRNSVDGASEIYTRGSCYHFYVVLDNLFNAIPYYSLDHDHIISLIGDCFYDINGTVPTDESYKPLNEHDLKDVEAIKKAKYSLYNIQECPHCYEAVNYTNYDLPHPN